MKLIPIVLILAGVVFIISAKQDKDPRNVLFEALGIKMRVTDPPGIGETDLGTGTWRKATPSSAPISDQPRVVSV